jgi:hypothetical protein
MKQEIKPAYITFEQAKWLKEKGFDVKVNGFYNGVKVLKGMYHFDNSIAAPEQWQVVEWLRFNHDIWVNISPVFQFNDGREDYLQIQGWQYYITVIIDNKYNQEKSHADRESKNTPQEAYSAAFDYILKELI